MKWVSWYWYSQSSGISDFQLLNSCPKIRGEINQRLEEGFLWGKKKNHMRDRSLHRCKRQRSGESSPHSDEGGRAKRTCSHVKEEMVPRKEDTSPSNTREGFQGWKLEPAAWESCGNSFKRIDGTTPCQEQQRHCWLCLGSWRVCGFRTSEQPLIPAGGCHCSVLPAWSPCSLQGWEILVVALTQKGSRAGDANVATCHCFYSGWVSPNKILRGKTECALHVSFLFPDSYLFNCLNQVLCVLLLLR